MFPVVTANNFLHLITNTVMVETLLEPNQSKVFSDSKTIDDV